MLAERLVQHFGHRAQAVTFTAPVKAELAMPLLGAFQDKLVRVPDDTRPRGPTCGAKDRDGRQQHPPGR